MPWKVFLQALIWPVSISNFPSVVLFFSPTAKVCQWRNSASVGGERDRGGGGEARSDSRVPPGWLVGPGASWMPHDECVCRCGAMQRMGREQGWPGTPQAGGDARYSSGGYKFFLYLFCSFPFLLCLPCLSIFYFWAGAFAYVFLFLSLATPSYQWTAVCVWKGWREKL